MHRFTLQVLMFALSIAAANNASHCWAQRIPAVGVPAEVNVTERKPVPFENGANWAGIPEALGEAKIYSESLKDASQKPTLKPNEVEFRVKSGGILLVAATWRYDGNHSGGWYEKRMSRAGMTEAGWTRIARLTRISRKSRSIYYLYRRLVKTGETIRFHTRKYTPPFVVVVPGEKQVQSVLAMPAWSDQGHPPAKRNLNATAQTKAATADVTAYAASQLNSRATWKNVPDCLTDAAIYDQPTHAYPAASIAVGREVEFTVTADGLIGVAVTWANDGNSHGDWYERRATAKRLVELGWVRFGTMSHQLANKTLEPYDLYYRVVQKEETIRFHTRKAHPPFVIAFSPEQVEAIRASRVPLHDVKALAETSSSTSQSARAIHPTVMLNALDTNSKSRGVDRGMLLREIVRQAVLIAARDELGVATRDESLREAFPTEKTGTHAPFDVMTTVTAGGEVQVTLFRRQSETVDVLWNHIGDLPPGEALIPRLVQHIEPLSRTKLKQVLAEAGIEGEPHKQLAAGEVPENIAALQQHLGVFTQYEALRRLHELIQTEGESPQRVAALARGYAHLGSLTATMFSPMHKVFKARALLYAARLQSLTESKAWRLAQRAYVRAFVGLHQLAADDLKAAKELPASEAPFASPAWVAAIEEFCKYDIESLSKSATDGPTRPLARYLILLTVEMSQMSEATVTACTAVLEDHPGCYRAIDVLNTLSSLGLSRSAAYQGPRYLATTLLDHTLALPHLPNAIRDQVKTQQESGDGADMSFRAKLIGNLKQTATTTSAHEPSLAFYGQLLEELTFTQANIQLSFLRNKLGTNADQMLEYYETATDIHPYGLYLKRYDSDRQAKAEAAAKLIGQLKRIDAQATNTPMYTYLFSVQNALWHKKRGNAIYQQGVQHLDEIYRDLLLRFDNRSAAAINGNIAQRLAKVSPALPMTVRCQIFYDWVTNRSKVAEWEKRYGDNPLVMMALGDAHFREKAFEDAQRCYERLIEGSQERAPYMRLALIYQNQGKADQWLETLERVLELPSPGLENARVRNQIAQHFLRLKEHEKAQPYADAAARSGAAWAMMTAGEVHTLLKNYERAEQYMQATARRYDGQRLAWFFWCHRTGKGNIAEANQFALKHLESLGTNVTTTNLQNIGAFYLLTDEEEKALQVYKAAFERGHNSEDAAFAMMLADQQGETELRDQMFKQMAGATTKTVSSQQGPILQFHGRPVRHLTSLLHSALSNEDEVRLDTDKVEELLKQVPQGFATNLMYVTGRFLLTHDQEEAGIQYLQRAATTPFNRQTRTLARHLLRKRKIEIEPEREVEVENRREGLVQVIVPREFQQRN